MNLFRGHVQCFELSQCSKAHQVLPGIVTVQCDFHWEYRMFQKEIYNGIPNVTVLRVLRKRLHLNAHKLSIVQYMERSIVCTPLSVNVFVTLARR
jgi:hypothetical protein